MIFEKRGFIVYLTLLDNNDIKYIESNPISDGINYLNFNFNCNESKKNNNMDDHILTFNQILKTPIIPFPNAQPHYLNLKSVVLLHHYISQLVPWKTLLFLHG